MTIHREAYRKPKIVTSLAQSKADLRVREKLIRYTVEAWKNTYPKHAKAMAKYLHDISAVDRGKWGSEAGKNAGMYCSVRLPRDLFITLRNVFDRLAPDQEPFANTHEDLDLLQKCFPKLTPKRR